MTKSTDYRSFLASARSRLGYWKSYALLQFTLSLARIMRLDKVSGKKLAQKLKVSAQQVSKVLHGNENITIETMAKFAQALDAVVYIHVAKRGVSVQWVESDSADAVYLPLTFNSSQTLSRTASSYSETEIDFPTFAWPVLSASAARGNNTVVTVKES